MNYNGEWRHSSTLLLLLPMARVNSVDLLIPSGDFDNFKPAIPNFFASIIEKRSKKPKSP